ncbi:MAG: molybdopterin-dependent oxidoreductase, partial [Oscillospiraceae bacterium]|nr:molybdopterin-dependent oxidoreductase [Oscillospiraceae bacterium]
MENVKTCYSICGICSVQCVLKCTVKDGKLIKTERPVGDEFAGTSMMCVRGAVNPDYVNHIDRIRTPLRRVGKKGEGKFEPISWEEAIDEIAKKLCGYKETHGARSVAFFTGFSKWYRPFLQRLAYKFGTPNYGTESSTCFRSTTVAQTMNTGFLNAPDAANAGLVIRVAGFRLPPVVKERVKAGKAKLIVIDPRNTKDYEEYAALHLRPIPGTDTALASAIAKQLIDMGCCDEAYIEKYVHGYEEYKNYVNSFNTETAEKITGVPAEDIVKAAKLIAENLPMSILDGASGIIHHKNGMQAHRAYACLTAITGCYGRSGGNLPQSVLTIDGHPQTRTSSYEFCHPEIPEGIKIGDGKYPLWTKVTDEYQAVDLSRQILTKEPYEVKAVFALGMNARMFPNSTMMFKALEELEYFVDCDLFMTDTAKYADIVLPAAASFERDQLYSTIAGDKIGFVHAICDGGDVKSDEDIVCALAEAMGVDELLAAGKEECYRFIMKDLPFTLDDLKKSDAPVTMPVKGTAPKPLEDGFATPTGKFELKSEIIASLGRDDLSPLPKYEPIEWDKEAYP